MIIGGIVVERLGNGVRYRRQLTNVTMVFSFPVNSIPLTIVKYLVKFQRSD